MMRFVREPLDDYAAAVGQLRGHGVAGLIAATLALVLTWFVYVPIHELLHAWGCVAAGGTVTRLEIAPEYGGRWLSSIFPYVVSGSDYAGQLTGFDTRGSDAIYLVTVLAPYLLTVFIGVPLLKRVGRPGGLGGARAWLLGGAVVLAFAPAIALIGDYYEAGSIVVSRFAHAIDPAIELARWRSDDIIKLTGSLHARGAGALDWIGVGAGFIAGVLLALLTYRAGALVDRLLMSRR